jgi:flagellar assembly protein FliH
MDTGSNVNTSSTIIKKGAEAQPYELGNFVSKHQGQNDQMKSVATLQEAGVENVDDILIQEMQKLHQTLADIQSRVHSIESEGVKGKDLDKQVVEAMRDLKHYSTFFEQATFQMETKLLKTSLSIAKKIIAIEVSENSEKIAAETIKNLMEKLKTASKVTIHLNPKDYLALKDQLNFDSFVSLQEDSNVTAGGVVIASDLGNFDGSIESKIQSMLESLDSII